MTGETRLRQADLARLRQGSEANLARLRHASEADLVQYQVQAPYPATINGLVLTLTTNEPDDGPPPADGKAAQ